MTANAMRSNEQLEAPPIALIHRQASPNDPIEFGTFHGSFNGQSKLGTESIRGEARLRFTPRQRIDLVIPTATSDSLAQMLPSAWESFKSKDLTLQLEEEYGAAVDVFCVSTSTDRSVYLPRREPIQVFSRSDSIERAVFHLMNWPDFSGPENYVLLTGKPPRQGGKCCGRFVLEFHDWKVTVAATGHTDSSVKSLAEAGGYVITHVGSIQRSDGTQFSTEALEKAITLLSYFFSFALGRWSSACLSVGFDVSSSRVYEEWGVRRCDEGSWRGGTSWFDQQHAELFGEVFPGFLRLWSSDVWYRPLTEVIYWYTAANQAGSGIGVDSALLLTQAALELLSWTYCVLDRRMVSENAFGRRGLSAADKLRLLASSLSIPLEIPAVLTALHAKRGKKWDDSMDAITDLRNGLVHPGNDRAIPDNSYYDAWRLSMWYLDLILLHLCDHSGNYANRLKVRHVGQVEPVPWEQSGS